jgi:hypothetical protein
MWLPALFLTFALPAADDPLTRVVVLDVVGDGDAAERAALAQIVYERLQRFGKLSVRPRAAVDGAAGIEGALDECGENRACISSLLHSIDVDIVTVANVVRVGPSCSFSLRLLQRDGAVVVDSTATIDDAADLRPRVRTVADDAGKALTGSDPPASIAEPASIVASYRDAFLYGGAAAAGVGVVVAAVAVIPAVGAGAAEGDLNRLRGEYLESRDPALLATARERQQAFDDNLGAWNTVGVPAFWLGALAAAAGAGAVAAALVVEEGP